MTAHELARKLLEGPDDVVCALSDHPASDDCEYVLAEMEKRTVKGVDLVVIIGSQWIEDFLKN